MKLKYVIVNQEYAEVPIMFPEFLTHSQVATWYHRNVVSGGFCYFDGDEYVCYGESISLDVKSRWEEDSKILTKYFINQEN